MSPIDISKKIYGHTYSYLIEPHQHTTECQQSWTVQNNMHANGQISTLERNSQANEQIFSLRHLNNSSPHNQISQPKPQTDSTSSLATTMAGATTTPSGPTYIVESFPAIENRITQAIENRITQANEILQVRGGQPNLIAARENLCYQHSAFESDEMTAHQRLKRHQAAEG